MITLPKDFAAGADISWVPAMEDAGYVFQDLEGKPRDIFELLKNEYNINAIRLRCWVNPNEDPHRGRCGKEDTLKMAQRAVAQGQDVMVDFHYSDSWADPNNQRKPKAWEGYTPAQLADAVYEYTRDTMQYFKDHGFIPKWVQMGNETNNGMMWPEGHVYRFENLASFYKASYKAIKEVSPESIAMIHLAEGHLYRPLQHYFDRCVELGCRFDQIGLSYYPYWVRQEYDQNIDQLRDSITRLQERYHCPVNIVEIGDESERPLRTKAMLRETLELCKETGAVGMFYWEPEGMYTFSQYALSAWQDDGRPGAGMDAYKEIIFE